LIQVLVVGPDRQDPGGVANFFNTVLPLLSDDVVNAHYLEIGSTHGRGRLAHVVFDQLHFWKTLGRLRPDIVHLNPSLDLRSFLRDGLFVFLAKLRRKSILVFFHGWDEQFEKVILRWGSWFFQITYGRADAFIILASRISDLLREWGVTAPIHLGMTAVDDKLFEGFSIAEKIEDINSAGIIRILFLSRVERGKGILELIEAVRILVNNGARVSLTIAGEGSLMEEVRLAILEFGHYQEAVEIVGYVRGEKKSELLRSHHIFCLPSRTEGMPISVLESMAFGMPIVTCPVGGIVDFFVNNKMGVLLDRTDSGYIAESIESLISSREHLAEISQYNYVYAQRRFLGSTAAEMLRTCYRKIHNAAHLKRV
jgi:glycosyltransferase involved in cell wall biosynthesis